MARSTSTGSRSVTDASGTGESRFGRAGSERLQSADERQREEFGGLHWGSAFFGWLVAIGIATLLIAILSAAGAAVGLTKASTEDATSNAGTVGIVGGILVLVILLIAYYAGGDGAAALAPFQRRQRRHCVWVN